MANQQVTRSLGAIVAIDAVGYSRQMGRDEEATRRTLQAYRELIAERVARAGGRVFGVAGDSAMAVLPDTLTALTCALDIESAVEALGADLPEARRMPLKIGIHFGRVLVEGEDVYGDDVNIAARIEALAGAGGICLSGAAFERVEGVLPLGYEAYGPQRLKNITRPVAVYRVRREPEMVGRVVPGKAPRPRSRWRLVAAVVALVAAGAGVWGLYLQDQAAERAAGLRAALHDAESRAADERSRTAELQAALQAAAREAARQSAEAAHTETLLAGLREAEARAATERQRAEGLLAELRSAKAVAGTAEARRAERQRAEALIASWRIAERRAGVERARLEGLLADLGAAASRAVDRADAAGARVADRNRVADLLTALAMTERKAAQEIETAEVLLAALREGDELAERARVEALLATLQEAGQSAAVERKRAELVLASWEAPNDVAADAVVHVTARDRAEALHARWREAENTAVTERLRAEALLAKLNAAEARARAAELKRIKELLATIKGRAEPGPEPNAEEESRKVPAREADSPTSTRPEDRARAPRALGQLAALGNQGDTTDTASSETGERLAAPPDDATSLEAVERLLRERQPELVDALNAYFPSVLTEFTRPFVRVSFIWGIEVLGRRGDSYRVNVTFDVRKSFNDSYNYYGMLGDPVYGVPRDAVVLVKTTGTELEITGHEYVQPEDGATGPEAGTQLAAPGNQGDTTDTASSETGEPLAATPDDAASLEAVERLLRERQPELVDALNAYFPSVLTEFTRPFVRVSFIWGIEVLGRRGDSYRVNVTFDVRKSFNDSYNYYGMLGDPVYGVPRDAVVLVKTTGTELEITGHEYVQPEDGATGPEAGTQLAAPGNQGDTTDTASSETGEPRAATPDDAASLEAVERLLWERQPELLDALNAYFPGVFSDFTRPFNSVRLIWGIEVLGRRGDSYRVNVTFDAKGLINDSFPGDYGLLHDPVDFVLRDTVVLVKTTGGELEITGHESVSD